MRRLLTVLIMLLCAAGCVSKRQAQMEQQQAYIAGQEQALRAAGQGNQPRPLAVYLQGRVQNPVVPWHQGLMLSQAIVEAVYTGFMNPIDVRVIRNGQTVVDMKGIDLLHHQDAPLEPGDVIQLVGD